MILPPGMPYAYSLAPDQTVTVTVTGANPVTYSLIDATPGDETQLEPGATADLTEPGWLTSVDGSEVDLAYPEPPPPDDRPPGPPASD